MDQAVLKLDADDRQADPLRECKCLLQLRRLEGRETAPADLALAHQRGERRERLVQRRLAVERVVLVDVDPIRAESSQRFVQCPADVRLGSARRIALAETHAASLRRTLERRPAPLRRDHHLVAPRTERLSQIPLAVGPAVQVGRVEKRHPQLECGGDDVLRLGESDPQPEAVATETEHRNLRPVGPETTRPHRTTLMRQF